jgi:hypothetical protein
LPIFFSSFFSPIIFFFPHPQGIRDANRIRSLCSSRPAQTGAADPFGAVCDRGKILTLAQMIVSLVGFGTSFIAAWLVYTLSEKCQDDHNCDRRKEELQVALLAARQARRLARRACRQVIALAGAAGNAGNASASAIAFAARRGLTASSDGGGGDDNTSAVGGGAEKYYARTRVDSWLPGETESQTGRD